MTWWQRRPAPSKPHIPAAIAMLADEKFSELPLGGWAGEQTAPRQDPPPPAPEPFVIDPPPWAGQPGLSPLDQPPAPSTPRDAVAAMKTQAGEQLPELDLEPPLVLEPLRRPEWPKPDWRQEELDQARRDARQPPLTEPAKSLQRRPA